jgi:hypothetical protein
MNVRTILNKTATATAFAATLALASACAHHDTATADNDYGRISENQPATTASNNGVTPIPGPVKVDSTGTAYTSSAAPGNGNSAMVGTNTNVAVKPGAIAGNSSVTYSEQANLTPPPVVVETPVAPVVTETTTTTETVPMTSSSTTVETPAPEETTTTTTTHKRMRKD